MKTMAIKAKGVEPIIATIEKTDEGTCTLHKQASISEVIKDDVCEIDSIWETIAIVMAEL